MKKKTGTLRNKPKKKTSRIAKKSERTFKGLKDRTQLKKKKGGEENAGAQKEKRNQGPR